MVLCFAIMPITVPPDTSERYKTDPDHFKRVAEYIFKPAAKAAGMDFLAPTSSSSEIIQAEIIERLEQADLVLCDISTWNANVFFELGIRVALDKPVALVRDEHTPRIPFDTAMLNTHTYASNLAVWSVEQEIPKLAAHLEAAKAQTQNALWRYFGITQRAERVDTGDPQDAKLELLRADMAELTRVVRSIDPNVSRNVRRRLSDYNITPTFGIEVPEPVQGWDDKVPPDVLTWLRNTGVVVEILGYSSSTGAISLSGQRNKGATLRILAQVAPRRIETIVLSDGQLYDQAVRSDDGKWTISQDEQI